MADISTYINALRNAVYGEDVRSALISAITAINNIAQVASDQGFCFRGSLASTDNLNNAVSPGVYKWTTGEEPINGPGSVNTSIMFVVSYSGQLCFQIVFNNNSGKLYYRNRLSSGTWSSWDKFLFNSEFVLPKIIAPELLNLTDVEITYFDKYIDCSGDTVDLTIREDSSTYHCMVKACVPGDRFYINSTGGTTKSRTFCFIDS